MLAVAPNIRRDYYSRGNNGMKSSTGEPQKIPAGSGVSRIWIWEGGPVESSRVHTKEKTR